MLKLYSVQIYYNHLFLVKPIQLIIPNYFLRFENRGLLSDLRAYMRQLMVKALEESKKNGKTRQRKASSSPKLQAINLLVVDYLFHEDYLYTVSVFASEVSTFELPLYEVLAIIAEFFFFFVRHRKTYLNFIVMYIVNFTFKNNEKKEEIMM